MEPEEQPTDEAPGGNDLVQQVDQSVAMHLVKESQMVLQQLLEFAPVWEELQLYYPKAYQAMLNLISAFESLSVMLQEAGVLHDVEHGDDDEAEAQHAPEAPGGKVQGGGQAEGGKQEIPVGSIKTVQIGGRFYKRQKTQDGWKFVR